MKTYVDVANLLKFVAAANNWMFTAPVTRTLAPLADLMFGSLLDVTPQSCRLLSRISLAGKMLTCASVSATPPKT